MEDCIRKYLYKNKVMLRIVNLDEIPRRIVTEQQITRRAEEINLGYAEALAVALSSELKEDNSYVTVGIKHLNTRRAVYSTAYGDGRVCANTESFTPPSGISGFILEVTRRSDTGGEYTGIVTASTVRGLFNAYFSESMQRDIDWWVMRDGDRITALFTEALPGEKKSASLRLSMRSYKTFQRDEYIPDILTLTETTQLEFGCHCSMRTAKRAYALLPAEERDGRAEIICKFCGRRYEINEG